MSDKPTIGFIGGGNMAGAIIAGLLDAETDPAGIAVAEPDAERREWLRERFPGIAIEADNARVATRSRCLLLAVKPQVLAGVCRGLRDVVQASRPLVVSIAAGVRSETIDDWLGGGLAIIRVMPNQPALRREGVSGLFANRASSTAERDLARGIMTAVGRVVEVDEEADIDTVTAVSGSGPAYFFLLIEILEQAASNHGLSAEAAHALAVETARGAASLAAAADEPMAELIARVRSPGGTTAAALDSLEAAGVRAIFSRAITAARDRAAELADQANEDA